MQDSNNDVSIIKNARQVMVSMILWQVITVASTIDARQIMNFRSHVAKFSRLNASTFPIATSERVVPWEFPRVNVASKYALPYHKCVHVSLARLVLKAEVTPLSLTEVTLQRAIQYTHTIIIPARWCQLENATRSRNTTRNEILCAPSELGFVWPSWVALMKS